jgi:MoxR-like ATPase
MTGKESTSIYDDVETEKVSMQLLHLFLQGRFGDHPDVPVAELLDWAKAVWLALAMHAVTDFDEVRRRISHRQGLADVLADVLAERFGEHPDIQLIAYRLAASPDLDAVMRDITKATTLDAMR